MHVNHGRLIRATSGSNEVTHHSSPKNGLVHDGHPLYCSDQVCRSWAAQFAITGEPQSDAYQPRTQQVIVDEQVREDERRGMFLVVVMVVVVLAVLVAAIIWFWRH